MISLPPGWQVATLDELQASEPRAITDGPFGSNLTSAHYASDGARVVRLQNIGDGVFNDARAYISMQHFEGLRNHEVKAGDLLIASLGEELPRACIAPASLSPAIVKADCIRVRLGDHVDPRWVMYAMQSPVVRGWAKKHLHGVGRPRLGLKVIRQIPVVFPSLREQRRIVGILEDHLARLDSGKKIICDARKQIQALRVAALGEVRNETLAPLERLTKIQGGIQKQPKRAPRVNAYPFLRVANVTKCGLDLGNVHEVELFDGELERLRLERGDLLVVEGNGSPAQIGRAALWDGTIENCVHQNHLIRVRPNAELLPGYLEAVWNSPRTRRQLMELASSSSGLHTLSVSKLKSLLIPVSPLGHQYDLMERVEDVRCGCSRLNKEISISVARISGLRKALLQAAFSGRLTGSTPRIVMAEEMAGV
ncbi:MAG: restriction endonuclease subunit S [Pseudonocardiaceae bacterium]